MPVEFNAHEMKPCVDCPDDLLLCSLATGELWRTNESEARDVVAHLSRCGVCRFDLREIQRDLPRFQRLMAQWIITRRTSRPTRVPLLHSLLAVAVLSGIAGLFG